MRLFLTGDLHLGRSSTRLPPDWREEGRTVNAWFRLVEAAIREPVDAMLLSGDLIDQSNRYWEAIGPLAEGVRRLEAAGIRVLAVSGNHDAGVLPDVAARFPESAFTLLGADGSWERTTLEENGRPALHVDGWSFPSERVVEDPTLSYPVHRTSDGVPVLGMVHGDPGVPDSVYAPLSLPRLRSLPLAGWLLGHIHRASLAEGSPWVLMPGGPHPLDPGEPGPHHAWIVEVAGGALQTPRPVCPARLSYDALDLVFTEDDLPSPSLVTRRLQSAIDRRKVGGRQLLRLRLTGRIRDLEGFNACVENLADWTSPDIRVERVVNQVRPVIDPEEAARSGPVPALLVEALDSPPPELLERMERIRGSLNRQGEYDGKGLLPLEPADLPMSQSLEHLLQRVLEAES